MMVVLDAVVVRLERDLSVGRRDPKRESVALETPAIVYVTVEAVEQFALPGAAAVLDQHQAADQGLLLLTQTLVQLPVVAVHVPHATVKAAVNVVPGDLHVPAEA